MHQGDLTKGPGDVRRAPFVGCRQRQHKAVAGALGTVGACLGGDLLCVVLSPGEYRWAVVAWVVYENKNRRIKRGAFLEVVGDSDSMRRVFVPSDTRCRFAKLRPK